MSTECFYPDHAIALGAAIVSAPMQGIMAPLLSDVLFPSEDGRYATEVWIFLWLLQNVNPISGAKP